MVVRLPFSMVNKMVRGIYRVSQRKNGCEQLTGNEILLYLFLIIFLVYIYIALYISRKYGAIMVGWQTAIKTGDYTLFLLAIPQTGLLFNVMIVFYNGIYNLLPVLFIFLLMFFGMVFNLILRTNLGKIGFQFIKQQRSL